MEKLCGIAIFYRNKGELMSLFDDIQLQKSETQVANLTKENELLKADVAEYKERIQKMLHVFDLIKDSIIGIGLNVNQRQFLSDAPNPVSLYQLTGQETDREALLKDFLEAFERISPSETTSRDYRERLYRKGQEAIYEDQRGRFKARLTDVLPDGRLVLRDETNRERAYAFKEVRFVVESRELRVYFNL